MQYTPNVAMIRDEGYRIVEALRHREIRNELMRGVKLGHIGHVKKEGLLPEIFYHPDHKDEAINARAEEAIRAKAAIAKICV